MDRQNYLDGYEPLERWHCFTCDKPISPTRPPVFNPENCSCDEQGEHSGDHGDDAAPEHIITTSTPYDDTTTPNFPVPPLDYTVGHIPPSNDSNTFQDVPCQEGIETYAPQLHVDPYEERINPHHAPTNNRFLEVAPRPTDDERIACVVYAVRYTYPPTLQSYLNADEPHYSATTRAHHREPCICRLPAGFINQGIHLVNPSMAVHGRSSKKSKQSHISSGDRSGDDRSWSGFYPDDPTFGAGTWVDSDGDAYECGTPHYPSDFEGYMDFED